MHDFGKVVYLDVQKTGSNFVSRFLRDNLNLEELGYRHHARIEADFRPDAYYFISARNPLSQYISLYKYGLGGEGLVYGAFKRVGLDQLYQKNSVSAFEKWLEFVLRPSRAKLFGEDYYKTQPQLYGFQTFRFLALSFQKPIRLLGKKHTGESLDLLYAEQKIHTHVVRTESLNEDLAKLLDSPAGAYFRNRAQVAAYLASADKLNQSHMNGDIPVESISPDLRNLVKEREWFLYKNICRK